MRADRRVKHGMSRSSEYAIWRGMIRRCANTSGEYARYGGRGIYVCDRWRKFENFYADMGDRPEGMSLDRIDNDGPYSPENCRWATPKEQARNTHTNRFVTVNGVERTVAEWAEELCIHVPTAHARVRRGVRLDTPVQNRVVAGQPIYGCVEGEDVLFRDAKTAARATGVTYSGIMKALQRRRRSAGGFVWRYANG